MPAMKKLKLRNEYEITWPFISPLPEGEGARCLSYFMHIPKYCSQNIVGMARSYGVIVLNCGQ